MQQDDGVPKGVDEIFGYLVAVHRNNRGLTQRGLAEKLTELGMKVDASAVSRIEKGDRSVRLPEAMTISEALEVDIEALIHFARTPRQELMSFRNSADRSINDLQTALWDTFFGVAAVQEHLRKHPELVDELYDERFGHPDGVEGYLGWVTERLRRRSSISEEEVLVVDSENHKQEFLGLVNALASRLLATQEEWDERFGPVGDEVTDGVDSEEE